MSLSCLSRSTPQVTRAAKAANGGKVAGFRCLPSIDALLEKYDAFLIDQFGTLHDGAAPYPGAIDALKKIRAAGRKVALLSNSGRSSEANAKRLAALGFGPSAYDLLLTSGELAAQMAAEQRLPAADNVRRCFLIERPGEDAVLDRFGFESVSPEAADLIIIAGSEGDRFSPAYYQNLLSPLARRRVPALCLNPDRVMLTPSGLSFGAGRIAETYAAMGGEVTWVGKPYPELYQAALKMLGDPDPRRVAGIGDSIEHDIAGARRAGCEGWLVRKGIIEGWTDAAIVAESARWNAAPTGLLDSLV